MARQRIVHDGVLILGGGLAGLSAALAAAPRSVLIVAAAPLSQACASAWAQGGIAAALGEGDTPEQHADDTLAAAAGIGDSAAARLLAGEGPDAVRWLSDLGAPFDRTADGGFAQGLEAAHGRARVARVLGDQAGAAIMHAAAATVLAAPHVRILQPARVRSLLQDATGRVRGALVEHEGALVEIAAAATVLATGGLGGLYAVTTNPASSIGEGLGLAALAGAQIADPEFVQFHPTALDVGRDPAPLATEALRGEGATLVDGEGEPFMRRYHALGDLAPRDIVARAVHRQIERGEGAFLDAGQAIGGAFPDHFPTVFAACLAAGLDPRTQPIPVAPAAHYHMGGVATDLHGRTSLPGLYAAGEVACTGVHGANRLASNSLLEAVVFGRRAGAAAALDPSAATAPIEPAQAYANLPPEALQQLRRAMSANAGVIRTASGLRRLLAVIDGLADRWGWASPLVAARLAACAALDRTESRGGHYREDFPVLSAPARRTFTTWTYLATPAVRAA